MPAITVTVLFVARADHAQRGVRDEPPRTPDVVVDVTGFQWQWTFDYEQQGLSFTGAGNTGPEMALPINETVRIRLHGVATDVIHSFYVPQFLYKKDVVPGRVNEFDVVVTTPGTLRRPVRRVLRRRPRRDAVHRQRDEQGRFRRLGDRSSSRRCRVPRRRHSGAPSINLSAVSVTAFDPTTLSAPADQPIVVQLHQRRSGWPAAQCRDPSRQPGWHRLGGHAHRRGRTAGHIREPAAAGGHIRVLLRRASDDDARHPERR